MDRVDEILHACGYCGEAILDGDRAEVVVRARLPDGARLRDLEFHAHYGCFERALNLRWRTILAERPRSGPV